MQKIDFGVLSAVRKSLLRRAVGDRCNLTEADLYTEMPRAITHDVALVLDIEEAWHFTPEDRIDEESTPEGVHASSLSETSEKSAALPMLGATTSMAGKVVFRVLALSKSKTGAEALDIANQVRFGLDGTTLPLEGGLEATFRLMSSVVDLKKRQEEPRRAEQLYEALVHIHHSGDEGTETDSNESNDSPSSKACEPKPSKLSTKLLKSVSDVKARFKSPSPKKNK